MSEVYEELGLEIEDSGAAPSLKPNRSKKTKVVKKKSGFMGKLIAFLLGILFAFTATACVVLAALTLPAKNVLNAVGTMAGYPYEEKIKDKILSAEYGEQTLLQLGASIATLAAKKNLAGLNEIAPIIGTSIEKLTNTIDSKFGIALDKDVLLTKQFGELPEYLTSTLKTAPLGNILKATNGGAALDPMMMSICYGTEGIDYEIDENGEVQMLNGSKATTIQDLTTDTSSVLNKITLSSVLAENQEDAITMYLLYGKKGVHYDIVGGETVLLTRRIALLEKGGNTYVYNEYGEPYDMGAISLDTSAKTFTDTNGTVYTYKMPDPALETPTVKTKDGNATIYYLYDAENNAVPYGQTTLGDLTGANSPLTHLTTRLTASDILGEEINSNQILKHVGSATIDELPDAMLNLSVGQMFESEIYETDGTTLKGTWKYLLTDESGTPNVDYKVATDMGALLENMTRNVHDATLNELSADGILDLEDSMLNTVVLDSIGGIYPISLPAGVTAGMTLGDLNTSQMLSYTASMLSAIP